MCGIAGIFDMSARRPIDRRLAQAMTDAIRHRGPDGEGLHIGPGVALGHRRLAIIDLAGGAQPLFNEDGSVAVTFNGEIYNYRTLVPELEARGHVFRTHSDTEVIVHAWEEWGEACVERFRGMFAFALWDERRETLFLARDRFGEKPLYYAALDGGWFVFGSELKSLLVHPDVPRRIDPPAVEDYFALGYVPDPRSIYRDVRKLPPAHTLTVRRRGPAANPKPYWDLRFDAPQAIDEGAAREETMARLREAVRLQMISDVPLGAFLSGGVDSSAVVAAMADVSTGPVETFSIAFDAKGYDESAYADAMARRYATNHHVERIDPADFSLVDRLATMYDEPFGDASALPTFRVAETARRNVTVALSGDGGDEIFAGYRRHRFHSAVSRARAMLPRGLRAPVFGALARLYPKLDWAPRALRAKSTFRELSMDGAEAYFHAVAATDDAERRALYSPRLLRDIDGYRASETIARHMRAAGTDDPLAQAQYADVKTYLPGDILVKVDRAAMANSLETRVPILDHEFAGWAATLPASLKLRGGQGKYVFKRALEPFVPADTLYRPKQGFVVPIREWFRGPLAARLEAALTGPVLGDAGLFDMDRVKATVDAHRSGLSDMSVPLWRLWMFESFLRRVHGGRTIETGGERSVRRAGAAD